MTSLEKAIAFTFIIIAFIGGLVSGYYLFSEEPGPAPEIARQTETVTTIIKTPETLEEYKTAFNFPIKIDGIMSGNMLKVTAYTPYFKAETAFKLSCPRIEYKNSVQFGYDFIYAGGFLYTAADVTYLRHYGRFAFGGGVMFNTWSQRQIFGGRIVGQVNF